MIVIKKIVVIYTVKVMGRSQRRKRNTRRLKGNFQRKRSQEKVSMGKMWWLFSPKRRRRRRSKGISHMSTGSGPVSESLPHLVPNFHPFCYTSHTWPPNHRSLLLSLSNIGHCPLPRHSLPHHHNLPFISLPCQTWLTL